MTKYAIETAENVLRSALMKKQEELGKIQYEKDIKAIGSLLEPFHEKAVAMKNEILKMKKTIEAKYPKMILNIDNYGTYINRLPETLKQANSNIAEARDRKDKDGQRVYNAAGYGQYSPSLEKEFAEVDKFVLGLKLGTAVMADVEKLLNKINNLK